MERGRSFRRVRLGPLVSENLCYRSFLSGSVVSSPHLTETLFHYYVWGFLRLFGFNVLSYEAAVFVIWLTTFIFTLLLVDLLFRSYIVTSVTALVFNFLPFAFIYTFAGYRYPMAVAMAVCLSTFCT